MFCIYINFDISSRIRRLCALLCAFALPLHFSVRRSSTPYSDCLPLYAWLACLLLLLCFVIVFFAGSKLQIVEICCILCGVIWFKWERERQRGRETHAHRQLLALGQLSPFDGQLEMHSWQQQLVFHLPIFQENCLLISAEVLRKFRASVYLRDTWVYFWKQIQILKRFGLFIKCLYFWWILFAILK